MTLSKLKNKNPKQLKNFLYNCGITKWLILDYLEDDNLKMCTVEQLCDVYHDDVIDIVWEILTSI